MTKVGVLVGSLRKNSFSSKVAKNVVELFPDGFEVEFVEIGNLPLFNQDWEEELGTPAEVTEFRHTVKGLDAVLIVTPEYNRSIPAVLKNALDVGSRPYGESVWNGKPAAIISQSPGTLAGFGANHHLRQVLAFLNMPVVQQPEAYIGSVHELLDENGMFNNDTRQFLQSFVDAFVDLIKKHTK
ncbi:NAD(P)H-dependent oxidoreductase [Caldibacillus thermolactis]|jgi:chromate reductase, NAD(P)H dehydrogenase (quinone)|uniref:NAD(P)H-dependent oxidoreductase n=1 Tax=Pallidibacillus thermolactis TaxID=251051 RepID=A0ABT2WJ78_9BACI|nr:NAD(P)H-dependent oxidoreductase [Pallidibacillus thermolactis]MCU9595708.1 NAD(P)H-dependent oxidoreductase [Pallidibacillus thermolactis]MCU9602718.1 NAD(P)H-dependent oxidoreductase [Pallidibacillus thermolactis subsp. kokeshiiformis]MED1674514.1 NAD(P)H-dependent oxidoreductase [Pallidibacillus thermolactis subsp. kokeshiiformis]